MSQVSIPSLAPHASPEFTDVASCKSWLDNLPLVDVTTAQHEILAQLHEFNRLPVRASIRLAVLEALRETVTFVQIEQAKRFTNRALPMIEADAAVFEKTVAVWEQMRIGYMRCFDAGAAGEVRTRARIGLICQRVLAYVGLKAFHYHRAYRQLPAREWRTLHTVYAKAEELGVADEPVKDYLNRDMKDTSPRIAYLRALLMATANPNELTQRQITFVAYLLERWAHKVDVLKEPPSGSDVPPMLVDLDGESEPLRAGAAPAGAPPPARVRYLDARRLAKSLRNRVALLRQGESPAKLALGEDCVQPFCEQLLIFLYRQWCAEQAPRAILRKRGSQDVQACNDMAAIHYYISGRMFRQPGEKTELTHKQRDEIATFGRLSTRTDEDYSVAQGFVLEHWQLADQSAQGMKIVRRAGNPGNRYAHGQLVAVRPSDIKSFILGQVRWLACADNGDFSAGIRLLPGLPAPVAVRSSGVNAPEEKYIQALSLTAASSLNAPPSLVLPLGWYRPGRVVAVYVDAPVQARLTELLERGSDYERVAYEVIVS
jgi:hypothetical protein